MSALAPISSIPTKYARVPDAARYLGLTVRSLADRQWRLRVGIPSLRIGRAVVFDLAALDRWLAKQKVA